MIKEKTERIFNAKILLFGEYSVIFNSRALTIPYSYFSGKWSFIGANKYTNTERAEKSNRDLCKFHEFLCKEESVKKACSSDLDKFKNDLNSGLYFESNIPQGYGVGSSGALVAAFYKRYCAEPLLAMNSQSIRDLKHIFSLIESFFHGTSSGMDPLSCYIGKPLLFKGKDDVFTADVPNPNVDAGGSVFLIDSGYPAPTDRFVNLFMDWVQDEKFRTSVYDTYIPLTNSCIDDIISGNNKSFFSGLEKLSEYHLNFFDEMIPEKFLGLWEQGLQSGDFYLKLCGSGGGGFFLGFAKDYLTAEKIVTNAGIDIIPVYKNSFFRN